MTIHIPTNAIVFWPYPAATIPANWSRNTDFSLKFLQGHTSAGTNGGAVSHGHTSDTHTHIGNAHNHTLSISGAASGTISVATAGSLQSAQDAHTHSGTKPTYSTTITYQNTAIPIGTVSAYPEYMFAIPIMPDDANQDIPDWAVVFYNASPPPTGFSITNGASSSINLNEKYILCPTNTGSGGGTGGTTTHTHSMTDHTHSVNAHTHTNSQFPKTTNTTRPIISAGSLEGALEPADFHHTAANIGNNSTGISTDATTMTSAANDPAYHQLLGIQNTSGAAATPDGVIIAMVSGSVPSGWAKCDGTNGTPDLSAVQIKVTTDSAKIGNTGGANTHTHTIDSHGHSHSASHTHTYTFSTSTHLVSYGATTITSTLHTHSSHTMASTTPTLQNTTATMSTDDTRMEYRTVIWIQKISGVKDIISSPGIIPFAR